MIPHERSLVEKMKDKPFALLGVNSDPKKGLAKRLIDEKITWRSWSVGSTTADIPKNDFKIRGWPTLFLIDHNGVIQKKWLGSPGNEVLDKWVEVLTLAAENDSAKRTSSAGAN